MEVSERRAERKRIEEEAARLVVAHSAGTDDPALLRWAAQTPVHGVALAQAQAAWRTAERLRAAATPSGTQQTGPAIRPMRNLSRRTVLAGGLAAAAALPLALGARHLLGTRRLETAIGERRTFRIADGSVLHLNTDTVVELVNSGGHDVATLLRGEAMFALSAASRSLIVAAGDALLAGVAAAFDLRISPDIIELVVAQGSVALSAGDRSRQVAAGQAVAIGNGAIAVTPVPDASITQRLAWRQGLIDLDGRTLAQAVGEFNRYLQHRIIIADPQLASIRLGGSFHTDDSAAFIEALEQSFSIAAVRSTDGSVLLAPANCLSPAEDSGVRDLKGCKNLVTPAA